MFPEPRIQTAHTNTCRLGYIANRDGLAGLTFHEIQGTSQNMRQGCRGLMGGLIVLVQLEQGINQGLLELAYLTGLIKGNSEEDFQILAKYPDSTR
ncbi:hypothetical protein AFAE65S_00357 [Alcaligenes phenolicus]